jgi:hypothetical protein
VGVPPREPGVRALAEKGDRLGADAASSLEHPAGTRVGGIAVQNIDQSRRLIVKTLVLRG